MAVQQAMALHQSLKLSTRARASLASTTALPRLTLPVSVPVPAISQHSQAQTGALQANRRQMLGASVIAPIVASRRQAVAMSAHSSSRDLLIVGPGVLGSYLGTLWKQEFPESTVTAQTNTDSNHERYNCGHLQSLCVL